MTIHAKGDVHTDLTRYENIVLDYGGVLVDLDRPRCIKRFHELGVTDIDALLDPCHQQGVFHGLDEGTVSNEAFHEEICRHAGRHIPAEVIDATWCTFLHGIPAYKLEAVLELRKRHHVILLSNVSDLHWRWTCAHHFSWGGHTPEDYFERIYLSYQMKMTKPDIRVFHHLLDDSGIRPEETIFLDDSPTNCAAARTLGIDTYTPVALEDWRPLFGL